MSRIRGLTLVEVLVVIVIVLVLLIIVAPNYDRLPREIAQQYVCAANLRGVMQSMMIYAKDNHDVFPIAGVSDPGKAVVGFTGPRGPEKVEPGELVNNVTASLWMMVRNGDATPGSFVCRSSGDQKDTLKGGDGEQLALRQTWDFAGAENLSYSPINMYHETAKEKWNSNAQSDDALLGDNNNADGAGIPGVHTLDGHGNPSAENIQKLENSRNHFQEGQCLAYGDAHAAFSNDPFVGPGNDNVYATVIDGRAAPPVLSNIVGEGDALLPITGNNGVSLSGKPGPGMRTRPGQFAWVWFALGWVLIIGAAVGICVVLDRVWRMMRPPPPAPAPEERSPQEPSA